MFYLILFLIISICVLIEIYNKKFGKVSFIALFIALTIILVIRYGQGPDYFGYMRNYYYTKFITENGFLNSKIHGEIGIKIIWAIFNTLKIPFELFVFLVAVCSMYLTFKFIWRYSKSINLSLLISYSQLILVYYFSAIRQGITISIFLGILFPLLEQKKYKYYILYTILGSTFHYSLLIVLVLIPLYNINITKKQLAVAIPISLLIGLTNMDSLLSHILPGFLFNRVHVYIGNGAISWMAVLARLAILIIFVFVDEKKLDENRTTKLIKNYYYIGIMFYLLLARYPLIASRITVYFKMIEIVLIPIAIETIENYKFKIVNILFIEMIVLVLTLKNIQSFIVQGDYYGNVNIINYPYITLLNKDKYLDYAIKGEMLKDVEKIIVPTEDIIEFYAY